MRLYETLRVKYKEKNLQHKARDLRRILSFSLLLVIAMGCASRSRLGDNGLEKVTHEKEAWRRIENSSFSFSVPESFMKTDARGIDSYVEEYVADGIELSFDSGIYSNDFTFWPENTKYEILMIEGKVATVGTVARVVQEGFPYLTQIHFKLGKYYGLSMKAACRSQQEVALARKIFESISFKPEKG